MFEALTKVQFPYHECTERGMGAEPECAIAAKTVAEESETRRERVSAILYPLTKMWKKLCESCGLKFYRSGAFTSRLIALEPCC